MRVRRSRSPVDVVDADDARQLIADLCADLYDRGWVSGTGGGVSVRLGDRVFMAPSGVQKEMIDPGWIFELALHGMGVDAARDAAIDVDSAEVIAGPSAFTISQCRPLFLAAMQLRGAGAVIHSHSRQAVLATVLAEKRGERALTLTHLEMLKGLQGVGYADRHHVPVLDNTPHEADLADALRQAIVDYPDSHAVLVKRHGVYVWGKTWLDAKRHAECYDELFGQAVAMAQLGIDVSVPPA